MDISAAFFSAAEAGHINYTWFFRVLQTPFFRAYSDTKRLHYADGGSVPSLSVSVCKPFFHWKAAFFMGFTAGKVLFIFLLFSVFTYFFLFFIKKVLQKYYNVYSACFCFFPPFLPSALNLSGTSHASSFSRFSRSSCSLASLRASCWLSV